MIGNHSVREPDVALVSAGIIGTPLGVLPQELEHGTTSRCFETQQRCGAGEFPAPWNNAGTGHAAKCRLNYTPERSDGSIDISKALEDNVEFDLSRQHGIYLVTKRAIADL